MSSGILSHPHVTGTTILQYFALGSPAPEMVAVITDHLLPVQLLPMLLNPLFILKFSCVTSCLKSQ